MEARELSSKVTENTKKIVTYSFFIFKKMEEDVNELEMTVERCHQIVREMKSN